MVCDQSFNNQSSVLKINVMVVDDDRNFLNLMSRMLEKSRFKDPSITDVTVIAIDDPRKALTTLKIQRNNIDIIVTDYNMPNTGMNGLQLQKLITQEFGNLPVIVMSVDTDIEQESINSGAMCFIPKPIKPIDLTKIYQHALTYKKNNAKSIVCTKDTNVISTPQQIQLLPEQSNVLTTKNNNNNSNGSIVISTNHDNNDDGSRKHRKRKSKGSSSGESASISHKKSKITWSNYLQNLFLQAIHHIGFDKAVPKKILEFMNVPYLTREHVASHLQKYREFLKKVAQQGLNRLSNNDVDAMFSHDHNKEPYYNYYTPSSTSFYNTSLNTRSTLGHGLGQSTLLSNTQADLVPYKHMSHSSSSSSSTYGPARIEPTLMANKTGQTSQSLGFEQHGLFAINSNNLNHNMMISYESLTPNYQGLISSYGSVSPSTQGPSHLLYEMQPLLNNIEIVASNPEQHANATTQTNLGVLEMENLNLSGDLGYTSELPWNTSNIDFDYNKIFSLEDDGDWTFVNINQGNFDEETLNTFVTPETNSSLFNMNPNQNQEENVQDFIDWSSLDPEDLVADQFMESLVNNDMN
ncbi:unnamed protein product [Cochlearia groenlandica]